MKPISPEEVMAYQPKIPDEVVDIFNRHISAGWDGSSATVYQKDLVAAISVAMGITGEQIFKRRLLDVEKLYESAGWIVTYNRPCYGDNDFEPYFTFKKR